MISVMLRFPGKVARVCACRLPKNEVRSYTSALFIPGNKANKTFALLSPHLDFDKRFEDLEKLRKELELRGTKIDADELAKTWQFYRYIDTNRWALEHKRNEIAQSMKRLKKKKILSSEEEKEKIQLITQGKVLKQELRIVKEALWEMEENVVVRALKLPNELHERTPPASPVILNQVGEKQEPEASEIKSHLAVGSSLGLIDYKNPLSCYLCDEAALFELAALSYAGKYLTEAEMIRVAGTDFAYSLLVEAAGFDHQDPLQTFLLRMNEEHDPDNCNRLHLVGGATLISFLAMHTKQLINPSHLPVRYFATGRQYVPHAEGTATNGLFTICQSSVVHAFALVQDPLSPEYMAQFELILATVTSLYNNLQVHYRTVMRSANELKPWESLRVSYEMWSPHLQEYVEIGHVSLCGRYLSKRLLIAYQTPTGRDFPAIISGTVLSVPRLLACLLEQDPKQFRIPTEIAQHMRSFS
ncbi:serine--tRNA synthetase-like protein Slimp [Venturia canescens]|uniref:serine--tRNA synthetase-like protein Slimp n=1 Tax=Venturia canescens TaxID=32260 RepID=UPI001C9D4D85|nr:serine--tRNA synthetase-like protein Slimp [Venturia canescens]